MKGDGVRCALYWAAVAVLVTLIGLLMAPVWAVPAVLKTRGNGWAQAEGVALGSWNGAWEMDDEQVA